MIYPMYIHSSLYRSWNCMTISFPWSCFFRMFCFRKSKLPIDILTNSPPTSWWTVGFVSGQWFQIGNEPEGPTGRLQEAMLKQKMFDLVSAIIIVETYLRTCRKTISLAKTQGSSMPWNTLMSSCFFCSFQGFKCIDVPGWSAWIFELLEGTVETFVSIFVREKCPMMSTGNAAFQHVYSPPVEGDLHRWIDFRQLRCFC